MKNRFIPFVIISFLSLLAGFASGNSIFYILFFTMLFLVILSAISLIAAYNQLKFIQHINPANGIKGNYVELIMEVHNDYLFPLPLVELEYRLPDDNLKLYKSIECFGVMSRSRKSIQKRVYCRYMGKWPIGIFKIRIYDIFGLFFVTIDLKTNANYKTLMLSVKPRIVNLDYLPLPQRENISTQNPIQKSSSDIAEMKDVRKYEYGDVLKRIHWKLSAAKNSLMVKNYSLSLDPDTLIYVDCSSHGLEGLPKIELEDMIAECAAAISNHLLKLSMPTKLIIVGKEKEEYTGRTSEDFTGMYEGISNISFDNDFSMFELFSNDIITTSQTNSIFFVAHSLDSSAFDSLSYMRKADISITLILVKESGKTHDPRTLKMISELSAAGITIVHVSPNENLNECIKEQSNEKKII